MANKTRKAPAKASAPKAPTPITVSTKQVRGAPVKVVKGLIHPTLRKEIADGKHAKTFQALKDEKRKRRILVEGR
jgi:hypothetical protein